jgi:hypothetical protein
MVGILVQRISMVHRVRAGRRRKKPGKKIQLISRILQLCQVAFRMFAESAALPACQVFPLQFGASRAITHAAKSSFEGVIRARHPCGSIAVKEVVAVTACHLEEVPGRLAQHAGWFQLLQPLFVTAPDRLGRRPISRMAVAWSTHRAPVSTSGHSGAVRASACGAPPLFRLPFAGWRGSDSVVHAAAVRQTPALDRIQRRKFYCCARFAFVDKKAWGNEFGRAGKVDRA